MARKSKLSEEQVKELLMDRYDGGMGLRELAGKYGLSMGRISQICTKNSVQVEMKLDDRTATITDPNGV